MHRKETLVIDKIQQDKVKRPVMGHLKLPCASVYKQVLLQNRSYKTDFNLKENEPVGENIFV